MNFSNTQYFPCENNSRYRKLPSEAELQALLNENPNLFFPVRLQVQGGNFQVGDRWLDGIVEARWKENEAKYAFEYKATSTPSALNDAVNKLRTSHLPQNYLPLVIMPYLDSTKLESLDNIGISGIDLCGNGVMLSGNSRIWRTGYPNLYPDSRGIKNPFSGDSSVFARSFLLRPEFDSLSELRVFAIRKAAEAELINDNNIRHDGFESLVGSFSLGTASKVVKTLRDELVVVKTGSNLRLQDASRLMVLLKQGVRHVARQRIIGKTPLTLEEIWTRFADLAPDGGPDRAIITGLSSAQHYKILSGVNTSSIYVDNLKAAATLLEVREGRAFANIELIEDRDNMVYFDARRERQIVWSSPIQTWLELASDGPREREAASQMGSLILRGVL